MDNAPLKISIVEDDNAIRAMLRSLVLREDDMEPCSLHPNAEDALLHLPAAGPDVVIMDISLPGLSGIECVRRLSGLGTPMQFLMYTVSDDDHRVLEALKAGADGYLLKGARPEQLTQAVRELHAGGSPMSAAVARKLVRQFRPVKGERQATGKDLLGAREYQVLEQLADGRLYKEIADQLGITTGTVKQHIHRIYKKLHVQNRTEAVNRFFGR